MSDHALPNDLTDLSGGFGPARDLDDGINVRFPPGLGLIPPPQLARTPRPRRGGELAE